MPLTQTSERLSPVRPASSGVKVKLKQNWILDPLQDALFIVATPLLITAVALASFHFVSPAKSLSWIGIAYVVFTVAHHVPTFIRIYGDVDLFRRFKWSFILGPFIPFSFAAGVLAYINLHGYPLEYFFYLLLLLAVWDPWHFLMQHYGFMRIYDRNNAAPRKLAARMDFWLCASWFTFIMLASGDWLTGLLADFYVKAHLPMILATSVATLHLVERGLFFAAAAVTAVYASYLVWCWREGYFVSLAKLGLFGISFGVMYFTYTPNVLLLALAPAWSFKVGFATMGIVHDTQYLAIVWRYNRSLVKRTDRAREGLFRRLYLKGGWWVAIGYMIFCLTYGEIVTGVYGNRWLASVLLALGFTSTLMHYYFDGFIWKVRHQQNRENLETNSGNSEAAAPQSAAAVVSWWTSVKTLSAGSVLLRQLCYFGVPMALLTIGACWAWRQPADYRQHMEKADRYSREGKKEETVSEARLALHGMNVHLPFVQKIAELQPTAEHDAELAYLLYRCSQYKEFVVPSLLGEQVGREHAARHLSQINLAIQSLETALVRGGSLGMLGSEAITPEYARSSIQQWKEIAGKLAAEIGPKATSVR